MNAKKWIAVSGLIWLVGGVALLTKGLSFIEAGLRKTDSLSAILSARIGDREQAAALLIALGLLVGFLKGRFVLSKSAGRISRRILDLSRETPSIPLANVYPLSYWILLGSMVLLAIAMRKAPFPVDVRGLIDVAIGSALIQGSLFYIRFAKNATIT